MARLPNAESTSLTIMQARKMLVAKVELICSSGTRSEVAALFAVQIYSTDIYIQETN
jgi:hypothetical protein